MKRLHFVLGLFAFAYSGLQAQTPVTLMKVDIPFNFHIGKSEMPAGHYDVSYSEHLHLLRLTDRSSGHAVQSVHVLTIPVSRKQAPGTGQLEFSRYGDTYFFAQIWTPNSQYGGMFLKTPREKELASRMRQTEQTAVALRGK
jgi:hypothetical protein